MLRGFTTHVKTCLATNQIQIVAMYVNTDFWLDEITREWRLLVQNKFALSRLNERHVSQRNLYEAPTPTGPSLVSAKYWFVLLKMWECIELFVQLIQGVRLIWGLRA